MDRSLYPAQVEVTQPVLDYTESSKAEQIKRRHMDNTQPGVVSGFTVSLNATPTLLNVAAGSGYAPGGELVELATQVNGRALSDYTANVVNYVCAVYTEVESRPAAHATDGVARNTRAEGSCRVVVLSATEYAALTSPDPDLDMSINTAPRTLVLATVTANGVGLAVSITSTPPTLPRIIGITQPVSATGITITGVTASTTPGNFSEGASELTYEFNGGAGNERFKWKCAGAAYLGPWTTLNGSTAVTSTDSLDNSITVTAITPMLHRGAAATVETLTVAYVYDHSPPYAQSAVDTSHRHLEAAAPGATNPHGIRGSDLAGGTIEARHGVVAGTALLADAAHTGVPRFSATWTPAGSTYGLIAEYQIAGGAAVRLYTSTQGLRITTNARWDEPIGNWWYRDTAATKANVFDLVNGTVRQGYVDTTAVGNWGDVAWTWTATSALGVWSFLQQLILGADLLGTVANAALARVTTTYADSAVSDRTLIWSSAYAGAGGITARVYRAPVASGMSGTAHGAELTFNCTWSNGVGWIPDNPAVAASKFEYTDGYFMVCYKAAPTGANWTDAAWSAPVQLTMATGGLVISGSGTFGGHVFAPGGTPSVGDFKYTTTRTFRKNIPPSVGRKMMLVAGAELPMIGSVTDGVSAFSYCYNVGTGGAPAAAVFAFELPIGARITEVWLAISGHAFSGAAPPAYTRASVFRQQVSAVGATIPQCIIDAGASTYRDIVGPGDMALHPMSPARDIIDELYSYYVWVGVNVADTAHVRGISIVYTLDHIELG